MSGRAGTYVTVLYDYEYTTDDGHPVSIREGDECLLLKKANADWWSVVKKGEKKPIYVPANYVCEVDKTETVDGRTESLEEQQQSVDEDYDERPEDLYDRPADVNSCRASTLENLNGDENIFKSTDSEIASKDSGADALEEEEELSADQEQTGSEHESGVFVEDGEGRDIYEQPGYANLGEWREAAGILGPQDIPEEEIQEPDYANLEEVQLQGPSGEVPPHQPRMDEQPVKSLGNSWDVYADDTGRTYYYNRVTEETSWKPPRGCRSRELPPLPAHGPRGKGGHRVSSLPSGWTEETNEDGEIMYVNDITNEKWLSSVDESGQVYYYKEDGNESAWTLPEVRSTRLSSLDSAISGIEEVRKQFAREQDVINKRQSLNIPARKAATLPPNLPTSFLSANSRITKDEAEEDPGSPGPHDTSLDRSPGLPFRSPSFRSALLPRVGEKSSFDFSSNKKMMEAACKRYSLGNPSFRSGSIPEMEDFPSDPIYGGLTGLSELQNEAKFPQRYSLAVTDKKGMLNKKKLMENGKKVKKNWSQSYVVLSQTYLYFYKDQKAAVPKGNSRHGKPEFAVDLQGATVEFSAREKSKEKKNTIQISAINGTQLMLQTDDPIKIHDWYITLSYTSSHLPSTRSPKEGSSGSLDESMESEKSFPNTTEEEKEKEREKEKPSPPPTSKGFIRKKSRKIVQATPAAVEDPSNLSVTDRKNKIKDRLINFLLRRPTLETLQEQGIIKESVFGSHLVHLCEREKTNVPKFVTQCIGVIERRGLSLDGIYRVSGNLAQIQKLRFTVDQGDKYELDSEEWDPHVLAGALKLFFRELKEPLFPFNFFDKFQAAIQKIPEGASRLKAFKDLIKVLPKANRETMKELFRHLNRVVEHSLQNRMQIQNVAIVFGPTLMWPENETQNMAVTMMYQNQIMEYILQEYNRLF